MRNFQSVQRSAKRVLTSASSKIGARLAPGVASVKTLFTRAVSSDFREHSTLLKLPEGFRLGLTASSLSLPDVSKSNFEQLEMALKSCAIDYWVLNVDPSGSMQLNIMTDDFDRFIRNIVNAVDFKHWYYQMLNDNGKTSSSTELLHAMGSDTSKINGVRLFQYVAPSVESFFFAGAAQGVDVVRWRVSDANGGITSEIWNPKCVELPNPKASHYEFLDALARANGASGHHFSCPVDAVITWVDGNDKNWLKRKNAALGLETERLVQDATDASRFEPLDELKYCLRAIEQYAPWIRKIFLVTDRQTPEWLQVKENNRLKVIDHSAIWKDPADLPVFNSHAIEANLHRIDGLAEHFLYLNDDMILTAPVSPDTFFHPSGVTKVFYSKALVDFKDLSDQDNVSTVAAKNARTILHSRGFPMMNRKFFHTPYAFNRSILEKIEQEFADISERVSATKFRSLDDVAFAGSFYFNYALAVGAAVPGKIRYDYIDPADSGALDRLDRIIRKRHTQCIVVNDGSQAVSPEEREIIKKVIPARLSQLLPVKSSFEL